MILTNEYKSGNISNKEELTGLENFYLLSEIKKLNGEKTKRTYLNDFHDKYMTNPTFGDFKLISEIFDFILTGYFDADKLDKEIKYLFYDEFLEDSEKTYRLLIRHWKDLEEDEMKTEVDKLIEYLKCGKYHIVQLPYLYTYLKFIQENKFLASWNYDIEKTINDSLLILSQKTDIIPDSFEFTEYSDRHYEKKEDDKFYDSLIKQIKKLSEQKTISKENQEVEDIFKAIISDNNQEKLIKTGNIYQTMMFNNKPYYDLLYKDNEFFQKIVKTNTENYILKLSNKGIRVLQEYIDSSILRISNAEKNNKPALEKIIGYIEQNIKDNLQNLDHYKINRLKELITDMKNAVNHIENIHGK
jgi:hypothetical protein